VTGPLYEGPFAVTPADWLDVSVWRGGSADGFGYFCSLECLSGAMEGLIITHGAEFPRSV
jgi:hypothetical protein